MQQPKERSERYPAARPDVRHELDRLFDEFLGRPLRGWTAWSPSSDLFETDDAYVLEMELPGFRREDIELTMEQGVLSISGERAEEEETGRRLYRVRERSVGRFTRSFALPRSVNADDVDAEFREGVLRVTMPKRAEAKPRRIEVSVR